MKDLTSTSFGYLIGFVLPGIFGIYALSGWLPQLGVLLQPVFKPDANVGPTVVFLLIAVGIGLCISAARYFVFEKWLYRKRCLPASLYQDPSSDKLAWHKSLAEEHYRYHQFYGGCAVAALIWFAAWLRGQWPFHFQVAYASIGFLLFELLLERSAADCFGKYVEKCKATAGGEAGSPVGKAEKEEVSV